MSNKRNISTIAAIGAAAVFGMFSFGNGAQAANNSSNCYVLSTYGLTCCDHMTGSRLFNLNASCHEERRIFLKRKRLRPNDPPRVVLVKKPVYFYMKRDEGGDNGGDGDRSKESKSPNSLR